MRHARASIRPTPLGVQRIPMHTRSRLCPDPGAHLFVEGRPILVHATPSFRQASRCSAPQTLPPAPRLRVHAHKYSMPVTRTPSCAPAPPGMRTRRAQCPPGAGVS